MRNPNAFISQTVRLDPPLDDRSPEELLRSETGISVELGGGRRVRLDPGDPRSPGFARVLDGLARERLPVYAEIDAATDAISRLRVPAVAHVIGIGGEGRVLDVELDASHARHRLRLDAPGAEVLERRLREALESGTPLIVAEDDTHEIIDVLSYTPAPDGPTLPFPPVPEPTIPPPRRPWVLRWLWRLIDLLRRWLWYPWWWFRCLSPAKAQQVFDAMAATTCDPLTVPAPCIPFRYPDDGCWARAHEMCRLMLKMGVSPRKVWIDHSTGIWLQANTKNHPQCYVVWGWHVAPTVCVRGPRLFRTTRLVVDPSLFTGPVPEATWKGVQGDPGATLTATDWTQFWHGGGTDPGYVYTNQILAQYRLALQARAVQAGPPPYANCP